MSAALGIGVLGMGTVGGAVVAQLLDNRTELAGRAGRALELRAVVVRDLERGRRRARRPELLSDDVATVLANPEVDVVVELAGGAEPAHSWVTRALTDGRRVVTANKLLLAEHGGELLSLAHGRLRFEAAVMAGVPVLGAVSEGMAGQQIRRIDAVLNGTSNAILEAMRAGGSYAAALARAQADGYAEADPGADVDGADAAAKLAILVSLAGRAWVHPGSVERRGIRELRRADLRAAEMSDHVVRLLASARRSQDGWRLRVEPTALPRQRRDAAQPDNVGEGHPLAELPGPGNGVVLDGALSGPVLLRGAGAGGNPTAAAVLADLVAFATGRDGPDAPTGTAPLASGDDDTAALVAVEMSGDSDDLETVRLLLGDRGVATARLDWDPEAIESGLLRAALLTRPARRATVAAALDTLDSDPRFEDAVSWLPVAFPW
ncbi:MAG: homoserine dehydrogenase [Candidatus Dormibacteria bacterium]